MKPEVFKIPVQKISRTREIPEIEASLAIRRDELKPEVRKYADNLYAQILDIYKEHKIRNSDDFETFARAGKVPNDVLRHLLDLTNKLLEVLEKKKIPIDKELLEAANDFKIRIQSPYAKAMTECDIGLYQSKAGEDPQRYFDKAKSIVAKDVHPLISGVPNQVEAYLSIAEAEAALLATKDALTTLETARTVAEEVALTPNPEIACRNFVEIAVFETRLGKDPKASFDRALAVLEDKNISDDARQHGYEDLAKMWARIRHFDEAKAFAAKIHHRGRRSITYSVIAQGEIELERYDEAKATAELAKSQVAGFSGLVDWMIALHKAKSTGSYEGARTTANEMRDVQNRYRAYCDLVSALSKEDRFDEAIETAKFFGSNQPRELNNLIERMAQKGLFTEAEDLTNELRRAQDKIEAYCTIAVAQARAKVDFETALVNAKTFAEQHDFEKYHENRPAAFGKLAITHVLVGHADEGEEIAKNIEWPHEQHRDAFYRGMANALAERSIGIGVTKLAVGSPWESSTLFLSKENFIGLNVFYA